MAYYSGQVASYQELLSVLVSSCMLNGWSYSDGILSKGTAFIKCTVSTTTTESQGPGLIIQGGTGKSGASLVDPSFCQPRLGSAHANPFPTLTVVFPCLYNIHIFESEVYLIIEYGVKRFYWLAFGISNIPLTGTGLWLGATWPLQYGNTNFPVGFGITGLQSHITSNFTPRASGPFWSTGGTGGGNFESCGIHHGLNGASWSRQVAAGQVFFPTLLNYAHAPLCAASQLQRSPSAWSAETVLTPIDVYLTVAANKLSKVLEVQNARFMRIDNYEPNQILNLGAEKWKVYPFHFKNLAERDGGSSVLNTILDHTGTFGWAIRYDGP
ncbi:hypothetical protein [Acinetobacter junii]|uniref:hypothetical protein n=1 Tax=Acinetobacter junii TaxID=40215 RepID=UPI001250674B|nr:hypothetical protein [Acinetobacter junii]